MRNIFSHLVIYRLFYEENTNSTVVWLHFMLTWCFYSNNIRRHCFCQLGIAVSDHTDRKHLFLTFPEVEKRKIKVLAVLVSGEGLCSQERGSLRQSCFAHSD